MQDGLICHFFKELNFNEFKIILKILKNLMTESGSSKKVGLYVSFCNSFFKT